jgi:hypothetical protein
MMAYLWPLVWLVAINAYITALPSSTLAGRLSIGTASKDANAYVVESFLKKSESSSYAESAAPWL